jgi:lysophospholipase L1-like esterase
MPASAGGTTAGLAGAAGTEVGSGAASQAGGAGMAGALAGNGGTSAGQGSGGSVGSGGGAGTGSGVPLDPALLAKCTGAAPIVCALDAPNGNYDVTLDLGADDTPGSSRAEAETRHAFAPERATSAGEHQLLTMTVNVRAEGHDGGQSAPGGVLDLSITGAVPRLRGLGFRPAPESITIFVAGDSTVCDWLGTNTSAVNADEMGWGQALAQYFLPGVAIANYADSGETAGGFYGKFFPAAHAAMKAGDYLFIQFGHNDQKDAANVAAYETNIMKYVTDARARDVLPVLFTPVARKGNADFAGIDQQARELAAAEQIALVDLTMLSQAHYATVPDIDALFVDGTHLSSRGATEIASVIAAALKSSTLPLKTLVR